MCYLYDPASNKWSNYSAGSYLHDTQGVLHQGKFYLTVKAGDQVPEVFDPVTKTWSTWAADPTYSDGACFVSWNNYILKFGGGQFTQVRMYDPVTMVWSVLTSSAPIFMYNTGCTTLPNGNVLLVGSTYQSSYFNALTEYNVTANSWLPLTYTTINHLYSVPMVIGNRVLIMPGTQYQGIEEYFYSGNKTTIITAQGIPVKVTLNGKIPYLAVPAQWFSHLSGGCIGI
jgi:hypothetical protein